MLREKRETLGFSLQEITDHLSIPTEIIMALESGDPSRIPESGFTNGFLRSYCNFLGIEVEIMIADLQKATKSAVVRRTSTNRSTFEFSLPKFRIPNIQIDPSAEVLGWISVTALLVLGWIAYSTFAPSSDPEDANKTEATTIDLRVPEPRSERDSR